MLTIHHCDNLTLHLADPNALHAHGVELHTAYFDDTLRGAVQTSATPPALGEIWPGEGGRYAGAMPAVGGRPAYHLILAEASKDKIKWGPYDHDVTGAVDHYDGLANTQALVSNGKGHPAAAWAQGVKVDELQDYYLPAHNELMLMWICAPHLFNKEGWYWSSTQYSPSCAWVQDFGGGSSDISSKTRELRAVAVRSLVL